MLISNHIHVDQFDHSPYEQRRPDYTIESDQQLEYPREMYPLCNLVKPFQHGIVHKSAFDVISGEQQKISGDDFFYNVQLSDSIWNKPTGRLPIKSSFHRHIAISLGKKLHCDVQGLVHSIIDWIGTDQLTPYIQVARRWCKKFGNRNLNILDKILEWTYGIDILRIMKVPSHKAIIVPKCEFQPVLNSNDYLIDIFNLSQDEVIPQCATMFTRYSMSVAPIEKIKHVYLMHPTPKVFYASRITMSRGFFSSQMRSDVNKQPLFLIGSLYCSCIQGFLGYRDPSLVRIHSSKETKPYDIQGQFSCQICQNDTASCQYCQFRDILFCHQHSAVINTVSMAGPKVICFKCVEDVKNKFCSICFTNEICRCSVCLIMDPKKYCKECSKIHNKSWLFKVPDSNSDHVLCNSCQDTHKCRMCKFVSMTTMRCSECGHIYCRKCDPILKVDISPMILFPDRLQPAISVLNLCTTCMAGRSIQQIQDETRAASNALGV